MRKKLLYSGFNGISALKRLARVSALCLTFFLLVATEANSQAKLLHDISTTPEPTYNEYSELINAGGLIYFISHNELWKSGGSTGNTIRLKKFKSISNLTMVGPRIFFTADDGTSGMELWKSDGSFVSTVRVKDIIPGSVGSSPYNLTGGYGVLYFVVNNNTNGKELWKSDGTESGTVLVKDIINGGGSSNPEHLTHMDGTLFFSANDGQRGYELWKTDGTAAGTVIVKDIRPAPRVSSNPGALVNVNGLLYFTALEDGFGAELWRSDGTSSGTYRVKDVRPGSGTSLIENMIDVNGTLFFTAVDGVHGDELWKSDGTEAGTVMVKDMNPGGAGSNSTNPFSQPMGDFANINGILYFVASKGQTDYIYRSDGTANGTFTIAVAEGANINPPEPHFTYLNGKVHFLNASEDRYYHQLWSMDYNGTEPTAIATFLIPSDYYTSYRQQMVTYKNALYTYGRLSDEEVYEDFAGYALIRSDGTSEGTAILKDVLISTWGSDPRNMVSFNNKYVYMAAGGYLVDTQYMWMTDGTPEGTQYVGELGYNYDWEAVNEWFYYTVLGGPSTSWGWQLWKTKGAPETSSIVIEQQGSDDQSYPQGMTKVGNKLWYYDNHGGVWVSEAVGEGHVTGRLRQFEQVFSITAVGETAFVLVREGGVLELWKSTATNLARVATLSNQSVPMDEWTVGPDNLTIAINNMFYFVTNHTEFGYEVWRSDGTSSGTYMMTDIHQNDQGIQDISLLGKYNNQLYVSALDEYNNWILYRANGDVLEGFYDFPGQVDNMVEHNGYLVVFAFSADDSRFHEVWTSDGGTWNTRYMMTIPLNFDKFWRTPVDYTVVGNTLFFGTEYSSNLWKTNGVCAEEVETGVVSAYPVETINKSLIFGGWDVYGFEPYVYRNIPTSVACTASTFVQSSQSIDEESRTARILTPFPNPFTNDFSMRIEGNDGETADIGIFTSSGFPVETFKNIKANTDYDHIGADWPKGMYHVKVVKGGIESNHTVVKK